MSTAQSTKQPGSTTDFSVYSDRFTEKGQGYEYQVLGSLSTGKATGPLRIRATIYRDSYDAQSKANIQVWTGMGWQEVSSIPGEALSHLPSPHDRIQNRESLAIRVFDKLLAEAKFILS